MQRSESCRLARQLDLREEISIVVTLKNEFGGVGTLSDDRVSQDHRTEATVHAANLQCSSVRTRIEHRDRVFAGGQSFVIRSKCERDVGDHALGGDLLRAGGERGCDNKYCKDDVYELFYC